MDSLDKIVPQAPQPDVEPDPSINPEAIVEAPGEYGSASMALTDDEPAKDVGGEVGRKAPRWNGWQIAGFVAGGVAVAAGIAAVVYARSRQAQPETRLKKLGRQIGLDRSDLSRPRADYSDMIRSGIERSRDQFDKAPLIKSAREKISAFFR